jgi:hypothetical protein
MFATRTLAVLLGLLFAVTSAGCIDNPPPDEREFGRKCTWEITERDSNVVLERWTYAYARKGYLIWQEVDYGGTGDSDWRIDYYYDTQDLMYREEIDEDGSGEPDWVVVHRYDDRRRKTVSEGGDGNGTVAARQYYRYDSRDRLAMREDDLNVDGEIDARTTWLYDENDNAVRIELDNGPDGRADQIISQEFEFIGGMYRLVMRRGDWDGNGSWDYSHRQIWNDSGHLVGREIDENGDGVVNERWRYYYDANGARTAGDGDTNGDGNWDVRQRYASECRTWQNPDR